MATSTNFQSNQPSAQTKRKTLLADEIEFKLSGLDKDAWGPVLLLNYEPFEKLNFPFQINLETKPTHHFYGLKK